MDKQTVIKNIADKIIMATPRIAFTASQMDIVNAWLIAVLSELSTGRATPKSAIEAVLAALGAQDKPESAPVAPESRSPAEPAPSCHCCCCKQPGRCAGRSV